MSSRKSREHGASLDSSHCGARQADFPLSRRFETSKQGTGESKNVECMKNYAVFPRRASQVCEKMTLPSWDVHLSVSQEKEHFLLRRITDGSSLEEFNVFTILPTVLQPQPDPSASQETLRTSSNSRIATRFLGYYRTVAAYPTVPVADGDFVECVYVYF
ncbi:uncharacterized protein LOC111870639 [Cryptotermes secundus]|uniref:uncharacterized protein LOC111870639 n=1 Tax=Cryptotermes secundus TaxID=105785 RepID=UPI000CD7C5AA|nr:uncharacterized protein LOC111870639 [Cryptotermes secundus]